MDGGPELTPNEFLRKIINIHRKHNGICADTTEDYICPLYNFCTAAYCVDDIEFLQNEDEIDKFVMAVYEAKE